MSAQERLDFLSKLGVINASTRDPVGALVRGIVQGGGENVLHLFPALSGHDPGALAVSAR